MQIEENNQIFIAKLHPDVTERDIRFKFSKYGHILDIRMKKGFAFVVKIFIILLNANFFTRISQLWKKPTKQSKKWMENRWKERR
jgi:hypothetical protein